MKEVLTFNDVNIVPGFSDIESRSEVDLSSALCSNSFMELPVIAANMDTVTDQVMARRMLNLGAQACLHRFGTIEDTVTMFRRSFGNPANERRPMVSIGLGDTELERAEALFSAGATCFVIDVAHGAQLSVARQADWLQQILKDNGSIVIGNFASAKSVRDFFNYFSRPLVAIKVGVGPGAACSTRMKTGVGVPQFTAIQDIAVEVRGRGIKIIGDGGLKTPGDIAKALGAGAHAVMVGSMLAGTDETPGEIIRIYENDQNDFMAESEYQVQLRLGNIKPRKAFKKYRGSASQESYEAQGKVGKHRTAEGESFLVPYKGSVNDIMQDIEGGLRSAFTYVGARNLNEFHDKVEFVRVSHAGHVEGTAHGKK